MKKYPVSYEEWMRTVESSKLLPHEMQGKYTWLEIHSDYNADQKSYEAYVSFLALHLSKLGKLLQGIDDV